MAGLVSGKLSNLPALNATLFLKRGGTHRILEGHPWIFSSELDRIEGTPQDGDTLLARDHHGNLLGSGIYNSKSQIIFRRYSLKKEALDQNFIDKAIEKSIKYRKYIRFETPQAERLFWSESDGLPGLIVDRYESTLVLQILTKALDDRQDLIVNTLRRLYPAATLLARQDAPVRQLEGLPLEKKVLHGSYTPPTPILVGKITFSLDLWSGQKTGFYLDQVDNYQAVASHAAGKRVLDCFTNQGGFALACLTAGATSCRAIDQSAEAIALAHATAARHGLTAEWITGNVFDFLRVWETRKELFDLIILDPPSFTKNKTQLESALRGYHELHVRALRLLSPGGLLATFSCSHHVDAAIWRELLAKAAHDSRCMLRQREVYRQSADHPILPSTPESEYLRGTLLEKII